MNAGFFEISKIAWTLLAPETLFFVPFAVSLWALSTHRCRVSVYSLWIGIGLFMAISLFPIGDLLLGPLEVIYPANPQLPNVDAIIILGGASNPAIAQRWGRPGLNEAGDRFLAGASLARRFPKAIVYFTGGSAQLSGGAISEAVIAPEILEAAGVNQAQVRLEGASRTTAENALFLRASGSLRSAVHPVLVTSAFHMPRAMLTFCSAGWHGLIAYPADFRSTSFSSGIGWRFADHLQILNIAAKEWIGLWAYRLTGRAGQSC